jgi:hypothetical protein
VAGDETFLHNEELQNWDSSPRIVRIIKSSRIRCPENVGRIVLGISSQRASVASYR